MINFGEWLVKTGDLDPVYIALYGAKIPVAQMCRLLTAYFCFYHLGVAAWMSRFKGDEYWCMMEIAARNHLCDPSDIDFDLPDGKWPRGSERRHFRGDKCVEAVKAMKVLAPTKPEDLLLAFLDEPTWSLAEVMARVQKWPLHGPWIAFKAADIIERVLNVPVEFPDDIALFYAEPRAALDMLSIPAEKASLGLLQHFADVPAPPSYKRNCNIQEVETICCKTKSYWGGHYWVGKDIKEVRHGLLGWGETAQLLRARVPKTLEQGLFRTP